MRIRARVVALAVTVACGGAIGTPAHAQDVAAFTCRAVLNLAAGTGVTDCRGHTLGTTSAYMSAQVSYTELDCPLIGTASGSVGLNRTNPAGPFTPYASIDYTRVGATAVVLLNGAHTGAAVGVFVPDPEDVVADTGMICSDTSVGITLNGAFAAI